MRFPKSLLIVLAIAACGKSKDGGPKGEPDHKLSPSDTPVRPVLSPPPKEETRGAARVINLLLDKDGKPVTFDVWARRSFKYEPVLLAKDVAYGTASAYYGVAKGMSTVVVPAGGGADAKEITMLFAPQTADDELSNLVFFDKEPMATSMAVKPAGQNNAPDAPPPGKGVVYFFAMPLMAHETTLTPAYGGRSFFVGDGTGACVHQRVEDKGFARAILGGTQPVVHDAAPGKVTFTFHQFPGKDCAVESKKFELTVDVVADKGVLVLLHTRDGKTIEALQLPLWK
jgi:hypothetical protein